MDMKETRVIAADQQVVWDALLDAEVLKTCIPGCQELSGSPDDGFEATVVQKVGPVKATFKGAVSVSDIDAPNALRLSGEGKGGAAGFARGDAYVVLTPRDGGTEIAYQVKANVGGKLAQLGSRLIDSFARKLAGQFFERFQTAVEGPRTEDDAEKSVEKKKGWLRGLAGA